MLHVFLMKATEQPTLKVVCVCLLLPEVRMSLAESRPQQHPRTVLVFLCHFVIYVHLLCSSSLQVTVKMLKRGSQGWLGKSLNATTTIPSNTFVVFRVSGEEADSKISANTIHSITLSI